MKKLLFAAVVMGSFLFVGSGVALATLISYTYTDTLVKNLYMTAGSSTSAEVDFGYTYILSVPLTGVHPAPSRAYVPGTDIFISAGLDLYFSDDESDGSNSQEKFKIGIDVGAGSNAFPIPDNASNWLYSPDVTEAFWLDGILTYNVHAQVGDFIFNRSEFTATWKYEDGGGETSPPIGAAPVPEPATMLLLGTGLVGVAGAARRRKKV